MTETTNCTAAVCAVMTEVHRLKKASDNKFANYKYVSVDDVKDMIRPLMAQHGLMLRCDEVSHEVRDMGKGVAILYKFRMQLTHVSGSEDAPEHTTVMLPYTGAQTTGAARSYAIKEWQKGKFLISTGEKEIIVPESAGDEDADAQPKTGPDDYLGGEMNGPKRLPKKDARETFDKLQKELQANKTQVALRDWGKAAAARIKIMPEDWEDIIRLKYSEYMLDMRQRDGGISLNDVTEAG